MVRDKGQEENAHTHKQTQTEIHMYAHLGTRTNTFKYVSQAILPRREEKIAGNASPWATDFEYRIGRKSRGSAEGNVLGHRQSSSVAVAKSHALANSCRHSGDLAHDYFIFLSPAGGDAPDNHFFSGRHTGD